MPSRLVVLALLLPLAATAATGDERALSARLAGELGSARALPDLYRLYELRDEVADLPALARLFDRIASDRKARADLRAAALELRAQLAVAQGQLPQAKSIVERAAPVRTWAVIGPFDNDGRRGLRTVYGPETDGYDPAANIREGPRRLLEDAPSAAVPARVRGPLFGGVAGARLGRVRRDRAALAARPDRAAAPRRERRYPALGEWKAGA